MNNLNFLVATLFDGIDLLGFSLCFLQLFSNIINVELHLFDLLQQISLLLLRRRFDLRHLQHMLGLAAF